MTASKMSADVEAGNLLLGFLCNKKWSSHAVPPDTTVEEFRDVRCIFTGDFSKVEGCS